MAVAIGPRRFRNIVLGIVIGTVAIWSPGCRGQRAGRDNTAPRGATTVTPAPTKTPTTTPTKTQAPAPAPGSFTLALTGDLLMHEPVTLRAKALAGGQGYDFRPLLAEVKPILSNADLAVCHMETPLSPNDRHISYYPSFDAPNEIAPAARWAGYQTCTTASNHTLDQGSDGVKATLDALDAAGLMHVGTARSPNEPSWQIYDIRGVRVAHLDYTYGLNGIPVPKGQPWLVNLIDPRRILADAHQARQAGAQFVMVALHWGQEYQSAPSAEQRALAKTLLASPDIDFVYGCHVHVVQPVEQIGDKFVVYGLGNFLAKHAPCCDTPPTRDGMIMRAQVTQHDARFVVTGLTYTPTLVDPVSLIVLPVPQQLKRADLDPSLRQALMGSYLRTVTRVTMLRADLPGVRPDDGG